MPVGEQAAGGSLGTIFYPARRTSRFARGQLWHLIPRFLPGRGLSAQPGIRLLGASRHRFRANLMTPGETLLPGFEAREIAAAGLAPVCGGAQAQQPARPARRIIVVLVPFGKFLPIAARTACIPPRPARPYTRFPAVVAAPAANSGNAHQALQILAQPTRAGDADFPSPAAWAGELHR
jgi:hypothetical protein